MIDAKGDAGIRAYTVGRSSDADIVVPAGNNDVSRRHARLTRVETGRFLIEDLQSSAGTFVFSKGKWTNVASAEIGLTTPIRLANFETSIEELWPRAESPPMSRSAGPAPSPRPAPKVDGAPDSVGVPRIETPSPALSKMLPIRPGHTAAEVFISYNHGDYERVKKLVALLEHQGCSVFWDRNINPGQHWSDEIDTALKAAKVVIVVWSQRSARSQWVKAEAMAAFDRQTLLAVRIDDVNIPLPFGLIQTTDLRDSLSVAEKEENLTRLSTAVGQMLQRPAPKANASQMRRLVERDPTYFRLKFRSAYLDMNGRMPRRHFWLAVALMLPVQLLGNFATHQVAAEILMSNDRLAVLSLQGLLNVIVFSYPLFALYAKRLHDFSVPAFFAALLVIGDWAEKVLSFTVMSASQTGNGKVEPALYIAMVLLGIPMLLAGLWPGQKSANRYGPPVG